MRNTRKEQMISALPPTSDIARQPRLTIESHLRLNPPASRCRAAGGCRLSTSPLAGPPAPAPRGLTSRGAHRKSGSTAGMGFAIARGLAQCGAKIVVSSNTQEDTDQAAHALSKEG